MNNSESSSDCGPHQITRGRFVRLEALSFAGELQREHTSDLSRRRRAFRKLLRRSRTKIRYSCSSIGPLPLILLYQLKAEFEEQRFPIALVTARSFCMSPPATRMDSIRSLGGQKATLEDARGQGRPLAGLSVRHRSDLSNSENHPADA